MIFYIPLIISRPFRFIYLMFLDNNVHLQPLTSLQLSKAGELRCDLQSVRAGICMRFHSYVYSLLPSEYHGGSVLCSTPQA